MLKSPGFALKIAALGLALVGLIIILGIPSQPVNPTAPVPPTRMIAPTATQSIQTDSNPIADTIQPSALPPTALPTEIENVALQATTIPPTATFQASPQPASEPILEPLPQQPVPNQVTIQFAPDTSLEQQQAYIQSLGGQIETTIAPLNTIVVTLPDVAEALLAASPIVVQTEPDYYVRAQQSTPNDPLFSQQWAIPVIKAAEAWPLLPANTPSIVVAVIDSGICANHPDLTGRILPGYDYVQGDSNPQDEYGHGCEVAGVIAANANNGMGVAGVAPNTLLMPLRVLDEEGLGTTSNVAAAITAATDDGAAIINLSLGGEDPSSLMENAVNYAVSHGVLVVAAAGNGGTTQPGVIYPAAYANVVAVASIDQNLQLSSFSSYGPEVDLLAPGRNILTTKINGSYGNASGTSFAAPMVSGIAALEMAQGRTLTQGGGIAQVYVPTPEPTDTWAVILDEGSDPNAVAAQLGYENLGQIGTLENTYLFRAINSNISVQSAQSTASTLQSSSQIIWFEQQYAEQYYTRTPDDEPLYFLGESEQWHLRNNETGSVSLNMPQSWVNGTITGAGVQIAIVDDGLQHTHPDLAPNFNPANNASTGSCDYNGSTPTGTATCNDFDPAADTVGTCGSAADCHGTAAAGVAAGADNPVPTYPEDWDFCGVGVAYGAQLAGIRILSADSSPAQRAAALTYRYDVNDIYNNSWGPVDAGIELGSLNPLIRNSLIDGTTNGRNDLGSIYVWSAGNGRTNGDNINADGYANSRYVIAVGATDYQGRFAYYSEPGAAMLVTAPSSGTSRGVATTDLMGPNGYNTNGTSDYSFADTFGENYSCTKKFTGTSASAPMVSGVIALMLQANPNLTWRDVQHILVNTARKNDEPQFDWTVNGAGRNINHNYGFGLVDASAAVSAAQTWPNVGPEIHAQSAVVTVNQPIPDNNTTGITSSISMDANIYVEHVEVIFNAQHPARGNLEVTLTSPDGTQSRLMERRINDNGNSGYINWSFTSVRHWGEHSAGTWTLKVNDATASNIGTFQNWQLIVYGTAAPPKPPTPTAPADGVTIFTPLPWNTTTFTWDNISAADHLELQLDTVNPPVADPIILVGTPDSYVINLPLGTYFWRVRAVDDDPSTIEPDWATIQLRTLTIATSETLAPARNYFRTDTPTLTWKEISWATGYQVEISTSATFAAGSTVYLTPSGTPIPASEQSFVVDPPLGEGSYYWRVRARKADGITWNTTWGITDSFVVDLPPN